MICKTYDVNKLKEYKYVVILSTYHEKILLSRHKERTTWETQGGHIEKGETPLEAAKRELYEESGAVKYAIEPLCDYWAGDETTHQGAGGMVFTAVIDELGPMPESEMAEVREFDELPQNITYPVITPVVFGRKKQKELGARVRELNEPDLDDVMAIWLDGNIRAHDFIPEDYWRGNYGLVRNMLSRAEVYVYEFGGNVQGFVGLQEDYVAGLFVKHGMQSGGIGKALLDHVKQRHRRLALQVYEENRRAVKFYRREGFSVYKVQADENTGRKEQLMRWEDDAYER